MTLIPISCIHLGSRACDEKKFNALIRWILGREDTYVIGLGDFSDLILRQDLKRFDGTCSKAELLDMMDSMLNNQTRHTIKTLEPLAAAGRILGLGEGNHEESIKKHHSYDITREVCARLQVPYLGYSFFYRWTIKKKNAGVKRNLTIYGHHGYGGGRRAGASVNKLEDAVRSYDADIIVMGHDHQKLGKRLVRLGITQQGTPKLIHKPVILARAGTFLKTCEIGHTTYSEKAGYPPTDVGVVRIDIRFTGHDKELDMHVSE